MEQANLVAGASAMLKELGPVYPESRAGGQRRTGYAPRRCEGLFQGVQFGSPDWSAGVRSAESSPVPLARWAKALQTAYPQPADPAEQAKVENEILHVEVSPTGESRDLSFHKIGSTADSPSGTLLIIGASSSAKVLVNGEWMADPLPAPVKLPPGKYSVRMVEKGMVVGKAQEVEVVAFQTLTVIAGRGIK